MRNTMLTVLGTVMCLRVKEMDQLQICDVLWHFNGAFHIMYAQTLACSTCKRSSSTTPTAVQPRHRNDSKLAAKQPPGHGPRPQRLGTRDRQPALKTRPARPPGIIFRAATAARIPALEAAKTCSQERSSSLAAAAAAAGRRGLASPASRPPQQSCPTHTRSEQPAMHVSPADNITRHRARPVKATRHSREVARNVAATLPRLTG